MKASLIALLISLSLLSGCGFTQKADHEGIQVDNIRVENYFNQGANHQYFKKIPEKVLVIGAAQTETLLDLEAGDSIAAAVKYEDNVQFPIKGNNMEKFDSLPFIPKQEMNIERVLSLKPDLIISEESWFSKNRLGSTDYWNERNVHTMVTLSSTAPAKTNEPETVEKEMKYISDLGRIFHKEKQAERIVKDTLDRFEEISSRTKGIKPPKVMILDLFSSGTISYGRNKIAGDIAAHLGAVVPETTAVISDETLMKENPDVVFVLTYGDEESVLHRLRDKPAFQHLSFIRNNRLYSIPLKYAYGPMTRIIDAAGYMGHCMYPDLINYEKEYDFHT